MLTNSSSSIFLLGAVLSSVSFLSAFGENAPVSDSHLVEIKFNQAIDQVENVLLPLNKVVMYRQAAVAIMPTDKVRAVLLLKRALADIDASERVMDSRGPRDEKAYRLMEFHRLPVIMLMERIDPAEALNILGPPQTADRDSAFQAMFFERLANSELVSQAALHKLDYGVSPVVVAAYGVLKKSSPEVARRLAAAIVLKLTKSDPEKDESAVRSAFALLRLLRTDIGSLAPAITINLTLIAPDSLRDLFTFIGDALIASKDPEMLILGERPALYVAALETYAPTKADDVKLLPFASPDAKSLIMSPAKPVVDANHPDPSTLTPEQLSDRALRKANVDAQMKETNDRIKVLRAQLMLPTLTQKEKDDLIYVVVGEANKAIVMARSSATMLDREAFSNGELEFYNLGIVTNVVETVSAVLQGYSVDRPGVAEDAANKLDGNEVQTAVLLQVIIREMTGGPAYLVPPAKRPPTIAPPELKASPAGVLAVPS